MFSFALITGATLNVTSTSRCWLSWTRLKSVCRCKPTSWGGVTPADTLVWARRLPMWRRWCRRLTFSSSSNLRHRRPAVSSPSSRTTTTSWMSRCSSNKSAWWDTFNLLIQCTSFLNCFFDGSSTFNKGTAVAHILGQISWRLPHQLTTKPHFNCVPTFFLYVVVEFVELTWHIRHDSICKNMWNFFFNSIFCHEVDDILTNGLRHFNRGFPKQQTLFYYFWS